MLKVPTTGVPKNGLKVQRSLSLDSAEFPQSLNRNGSMTVCQGYCAVAEYLHDALCNNSNSPGVMDQGKEWEILGGRGAERIVK